MANTNIFATKLSARLQVTRYSTPVFTAQASFEERSKLVDGESVVRPTFGKLYADSYTRGTDLTEQGYTETSETLTVNQTPAILLRADRWDALQHSSPLQAHLAKEGMRAVNKKIDADYLAEAASATSTVTAGDLPGGSGTGAITLSGSNVLAIWAAAQRKLQNLDVDIVGARDPRPDLGNMKPGGSAGFANLSPHVQEQFTLALSGRESVDGDMVGRNAYKASYFDFDNFVTTNGLWVGVLGLATNPTTTDTLVINGVTVTFVDTLSAATGASEVHIASTVDITRANLVEFLNSPTSSEAEAADTGYSSMSQANADKLRRMTFTNSNSADTMTISAEGYGYVVVSETLTDLTDAWTSETSKQLFGQKGAIDMVMQANVDVEISDIPRQFGKYIKPRALYGIKTFSEGADALVAVHINSASWA